MKIGGSDASPVMSDDFFKKIDQDGNGKTTKDELKSQIGERGGTRPAGAPSLDDLFAAIDSNGDDAIDLDEHKGFAAEMASRRPLGPPDPGAMAEKLFAKADDDGDGAISKEDLLKALPKQLQSSMLDELFSDADEDGDGAITESQLKTAMIDHFSRNAQYDRQGDLSRIPPEPRTLTNI